MLIYFKIPKYNSLTNGIKYLIIFYTYGDSIDMGIGIELTGVPETKTKNNQYKK